MKKKAQRISRAKKRPTQKSLKEKRQNPRLPVLLQVRHRLQQDYLVDFAHDISPGGIFIRTQTPLPKGTRVELVLPGTETGKPQMVVEGQVVWSQPENKRNPDRFGMGIEFTRIDIEGQKYIDNVINDFLRKLSII